MFVYLDDTYTRIEFVEGINLQWRRRYYEIGEFELQILSRQYIPEAKFVLNTETLEVGEINKVELKNTANIGKYILLSGYFVEAWLNRGIKVNKGVIPQRNIVNACAQLVRDRVINDLGLTRLVQGEHKPTSETAEGCDESLSEIYQINRSLLLSIDYGQKVTYNAAEKNFVYQIYQGVDRTVEGPNYCLFSDKIGNINEINYSDDDTDLKNFAIIRIDRGDERIIQETYSAMKEGEEPRKMLIEISDSESETDEIARAKAKDQAKLELLNHMRVTNISFTPVLNAMEYLVDYDLGDKIQLNINELAKTYGFRIVGVNEVYKNNTQDLELIFGDIKKMNYDKRRL